MKTKKRMLALLLTLVLLVGMTQVRAEAAGQKNPLQMPMWEKSEKRLRRK